MLSRKVISRYLIVFGSIFLIVIVGLVIINITRASAQGEGTQSSQGIPPSNSPSPDNQIGDNALDAIGNLGTNPMNSEVVIQNETSPSSQGMIGYIQVMPDNQLNENAPDSIGYSGPIPEASPLGEPSQGLYLDTSPKLEERHDIPGPDMELNNSLVR